MTELSLTQRLVRNLLPGRNLVVAVPWFWLALFFVLPFLFVLKISLSEPQLMQPPYQDWIREIEDGLMTITINFGNYFMLLEDELYRDALWGSLWSPVFPPSSVFLIGYPMVLCHQPCPKHLRVPLLMLVILPFWTSFLLRVYAWIGILKENGLLNQVLMSLGVINEPLQILHTNIAVYIGVVYTYLPFLFCRCTPP